MSGVRTELEIAFRLIWDPTKPTTEGERGLMLKAIGLAKEVQTSRGAHDPTLALIEDRIHCLPAPTPVYAVGRLESPVQQAEREVIERTLPECPSFSQAALRLRMARATLRLKLARYGIPIPAHYKIIQGLQQAGA